jgi:predicted metal-dependent hydrolase
MAQPRQCPDHQPQETLPLFLGTLRRWIENRDQTATNFAALETHLRTAFGATLKFKMHPRARRLTLRVKTNSRKIVVTMPRRTAKREAHLLVQENYDWIVAQLSDAEAPVLFADGVIIPFRGQPHTLRFHPRQAGKGIVTQVPSETGSAELHVFGAPEHCPRRLHDWLKKQARTALNQAVSHHCQTLDVSYRRISVRDQSSRWGSCSTSGTLSFSWRLILAPPDILDYVAAHEVAHLLEMNHSAAFWDLVRRLRPDYEGAETWLNEEGRHLHRYAHKFGDEA